MPSDLRPVAIDCFAGAGGLSLGLVTAGFRLGAAFDSSREAAATYGRNLGAHVLTAEAETITGGLLLDMADVKRGECALVAGGPPCQGFSVQRRGDDNDARNDLVFEFIRIVGEIEPEAFLMENVSALAARRGQPYLAELLRRADRLGYHTQSCVLDAADYGVPQRRRRLFVVGERTDCAARFEFPEPSHKQATYVTVRDAIGDLPPPTTDPAVLARYHNHEPDNMSTLNRERISHVPPGGGRADIPVALRLPCHRVDVSRAGHRGVYGRLAWNAPAGAITTKCNSFTRGRFAHPVENRNISMREAARLQGFPDTFVFVGGKVPTAHQIGNAVPPPLAAALGRALLAALEARHGGATPNARTSQMALTF